MTVAAIAGWASAVAGAGAAIFWLLCAQVDIPPTHEMIAEWKNSEGKHGTIRSETLGFGAGKALVAQTNGTSGLRVSLVWLLFSKAYRSLFPDAMRPAVQILGLRSDEYHRGRRVWGEPDFVHLSWDTRARREIADCDTVLFAKGDGSQPPGPFNSPDLVEELTDDN